MTATAPPARLDDDRPVRLRQRLAAPPTIGAVVGMTALWWMSLRPSLLPRSGLIQGVVSGICMAVGYGLGGWVGRVVAARWTPSATVRRWSGAVVAIGVASLAALGSNQWLEWQRDQQALVQVPPHSWTAIPVMLVVAVVVTAVLVTIARTIRHAVAALHRAVARRLNRYVGATVAVIVTLVVLVGVSFGFRQFARWADTNFGAFDQGTEEGVTQPDEPTVSGSPASLVAWDDLGLQGRSFVAGAPAQEDLRAFRPGEAVVEPIRVYVGLQSAETTEERIDLAVDELERTGAFDRQVLVVVVPTGTGWVNPDAARTLEFMYGGDTAIVSVQYSFLPSWVAFLVDTNSPRVLGRALVDRIYDEWAARPADARPTLLLYGESLGSMGAESAFATGSLSADLASLASRYEGALFVGPTRNNAIFGTMIDQRDAGSPTWRPVLADEPGTQVATKVADIVDADTPAWTTPRMLWVHHPSDAIGTWKISNLWSSPGWADDPAPHDIPPAATWVPFVTFVQETFDLMNGFSATPGFGHDYRTDLVNGWAAIAPPAGWTTSESARLRTFLDLDGGP